MNTVYIVVRKDIKIEWQMVQVCHATLEMTRAWLNVYDEHPKIVILGVENTWELDEVGYQLELEGISYGDFKEDFNNLSYCALATIPLNKRELATNSILHKLDLLKL